MNWNESRLSRRPYYGKRTKLAKWNDDEFWGKGWWLHATKGLRFMSEKRANAIARVAEMTSNVFPTQNEPSDMPRYFPHQGLKECARRRRQMAKIAARKEVQ